MSNDEEYNHMDEVVHNLWIGDIQSSKDVEQLKAHNIHSVLTAMRGRVSIHVVGHCAHDQLFMTLKRSQTLKRLQILLDDTAEADILQHLIPSITFIEAELEKDRGILVHCQAGMSA